MKQLTMQGLPPRKSNEEKNKRLRWQNGFQRWSDRQSKDESTPLGKCGYSDICDYCFDNGHGKPCVRALNSMCKDKNIKIDYDKRNYQEIWEM